MAALLNIFTGIEHTETNQQDMNAGQQSFVIALLCRVKVILHLFLAALESLDTGESSS